MQITVSIAILYPRQHSPIRCPLKMLISIKTKARQLWTRAFFAPHVFSATIRLFLCCFTNATRIIRVFFIIITKIRLARFCLLIFFTKKKIVIKMGSSKFLTLSPRCPLASFHLFVPISMHSDLSSKNLTLTILCVRWNYWLMRNVFSLASFNNVLSIFLKTTHLTISLKIFNRNQCDCDIAKFPPPFSLFFSNKTIISFFIFLLEKKNNLNNISEPLASVLEQTTNFSRHYTITICEYFIVHFYWDEWTKYFLRFSLLLLLLLTLLFRIT